MHFIHEGVQLRACGHGVGLAVCCAEFCSFQMILKCGNIVTDALKHVQICCAGRGWYHTHVTKISVQEQFEQMQTFKFTT
jgi:hypothetical protein